MPIIYHFSSFIQYLYSFVICNPTVLVNNAEIGSEINVQNAEQDLKEAKLTISKFSENEKNPEKIKALKEVSKAETRIQAAKN